ncbi:bifunctional 5,10-methylenetetrahydrofolate dehydrogenase/5,10-methenyltetrahydrofolate cyclohydrolase [Streptomyces sp. NPDC020951]|uniref:bifunctional 5,10-methylenetetrahydrofolate dehydrogenase/5,10-methenyltetrahydrofolate cyclohydrolase n=1 Tax=Streptomyces sp. NPDC020951 TaxID=3365104 RepID=UPI00379CFF33
MTAELIDGKKIAAAVRQAVTEDVVRFVEEHDLRPGLATVLVGSDPASQVYVTNKRRLCTAAGMRDLHRWLPEDVSQQEAESLLDELAADPEVSGILLQLPVPPHLDAEALIERIPSGKDVDGLTTASVGLLTNGRPGLRPCTPAGIIELLDRVGEPIAGRHAVVVGRSPLVGRPMVSLLLQRDATVSVCHSKTPDLVEMCRSADILVVAAGRPGLVGPAAVSPGATVIDVGIHRTDSGLVGDVDFEGVRRVAGRITPVPGGVGPMTIAMLLHNTLAAARSRHTNVLRSTR